MERSGVYQAVSPKSTIIEDIQKFVEWASVQGRDVKITIEWPSFAALPSAIRAQCYDSKLGEVQNVYSFAELDLEKKADEREQREYERLKAKFENQ